MTASSIHAEPISKKHSKRAHALCSASGAERWLNCPGSVGLSEELPPEPSSPAASEGTRAHELAERILRDWEAKGRVLDLVFVDSLRPEYADTHDDDKGGWSMVDFALTYVHACLGEVEAFDADLENPVAVRLEQRLEFNAEMGMFGTADFFATGTRGGVPYGVVVDLKYGKKKVNVVDNPQLGYYAVALKKGSKRKLEKVKVRVVQPRIDHWFSDVEYTAAELSEWHKTLTLGAEKAILQIGSKSPELKAGGWCWFCPARSICPEKEREAHRKAAELFDDAPA